MLNAVAPYSLFVILAAIILAYCLPFFHLRRWKKLTSVEAALLAPGAASLLFGAAAFFTHAAGLNQRVVHAVVLALLTVSIIPQLARSTRSGDGSYRRPVLTTIAFLGLILSLQAAYQIFVGGFWYFDWWQHYSLSQMYMGKVSHDYLWLGMYNFASRTPLFNLNAAFFLSLFGDRFWIYQIVSSILNVLFILPVYALCERFTSRRTTVLIMAALFFSPSLVHNAWYAWPKLFAAYFVLAAAYVYLAHRQKDQLPEPHVALLVFVLIWTGFFAHQSSFFSGVVILIDMFFLAFKRAPAKIIPLALTCAASFAVIDGIWFAWASHFLGVAGTLLSYYERPATVGGVSGYIVLFTYHVLSAICSPLFVYDIAGRHFDYLRFLQNMQALYYNSLVGFCTISLSLALAATLAVKAIAGKSAGSSILDGRTVRWSLLVLSVWSGGVAGLTLFGHGFGAALFARHFNHPEFARKMFGGYFAAGAAALLLCLFLISLHNRRLNRLSMERKESEAGVLLLYWMAVAGYLGGIATVHEIYIHGIVSATSATAVVLSIMLLARLASDFPRWMKLVLAVPILAENFLVLWFPVLVLRYNWGWAGEKNWQLKNENSLRFLADIFPHRWEVLVLAGFAVQAFLVGLWVLLDRKDARARPREADVAQHDLSPDRTD